MDAMRAILCLLAAFLLAVLLGVSPGAGAPVRPRVTIVFEHAGSSLTDLAPIYAMHLPFGLGIFPKMRYSAQVARQAADHGLTPMLHLPMEARHPPDMGDVPGAVWVRMTDAEIWAMVEEDLANAEGAERVARAVSDLPIAVLVNNAGFGAAGRFDKLQAERLRDMVTVNCVAPMVLTRRILPRMQERRSGAVIFTGSVAGRQPLPLHGVYSATKAFDQLLGEALYVEQRRFGIDVLVVEPGSTETEFHGVAGELPHEGGSPEAVVETALEALGRQPSVVSGWWNWLRANAAQRIAPRSLLVHLAHEYTRRQTPEDLQ